MNLLITGAAGNLGSHLTRYLIDSQHNLKLLVHHKQPPSDLLKQSNVSLYQGDLGRPETLLEACKNTDVIVHFAGVLFAPGPEKFLPVTNAEYVKNLTGAALANGVKKIILISFPHVEGESFPENMAKGVLHGNPNSVHAQTRLLAEQHIFNSCKGKGMIPVSLRPGMIYGRGVLMIDAARWLLEHHLLAVWRKPTWIHLLALPDFLACVKAAIDIETVSGIYNLGDDLPLTLQEFFDVLADHLKVSKPWRFPSWSFYLAAWCCELFATIFKIKSPLTKDFIKIGIASYVSDTSRMKKELLPQLAYPSLKEGLVLF